MKQLLLSAICSVFACTLFAQGISGKIVDFSNAPISDAYIYTSSKDKHTHSNALGEFQIPDAVVGDTIVVSFIGFETVRQPLTATDLRKNITIKLESEAFDLEQVNITNSIKAINTVTSIDLKVFPVNSSQELLRSVPGLFIGQHAGGGKAEQIFLRGFDIDHGTDIAINVDGMPVNMVSHAHGQGYSDLHFLIPETVESIDFAKGPYYADQGNFNTAGYVNFKTMDRLDRSSFGVEFGSFNTFRMVGLIDLLGNQEKHNAYVASEYILSDGPFDSPQNFQRINVMGKYSTELADGGQLSLLVSRFQSRWNASGQIPQRLVDDGTISRFGAVDDTEGGNTSRTNVAIAHTKRVNSNVFVKSNAYFSHYDFELFSNFTFFLEDRENGDQIRQFEDRRIYGVNSTLFQETQLFDTDLEMSYGVGLRFDDVDDNELSRTANRITTLEQLAYGDVEETNLFGFINAELDFDKWMINAGLRLDAFEFDYVDLLSPTYSNESTIKTIVTPKLNIIYNPSTEWQLFLKSGIGFHSNDSRVVINKTADDILPAAYGADLGAVWKPLPRLWISPALWVLYLEQEFVYVGDAGIVEPSGKTLRQGIDLSMRYQIGRYLFLNGDVNYTYARATEEEEGADRIPLAPEFTSMGGLSFRHPSGFNAALRYRYIRDRPANEDNSIIAEGYFITDFNANYTFSNVTIGMNIENLFNQEWNEAQFATESQLLNELVPVEELHFTPGVPFYIEGTIKYSF
jgi:outer membrane receptor protein involved in Fe transport